VRQFKSNIRFEIANFRRKYLRFLQYVCQRSPSFHRHSCFVLKLFTSQQRHRNLFYKKWQYLNHDITNIKGNFSWCDKMKCLMDCLVSFRCLHADIDWSTTTTREIWNRSRRGKLNKAKQLTLDSFYNTFIQYSYYIICQFVFFSLFFMQTSTTRKIWSRKLHQNPEDYNALYISTV
jgi:hypothetical protein